jgi:hypothetical protein
MGYATEGESVDGIYHRTPPILEGEARGSVIFSPHATEQVNDNARFIRVKKEQLSAALAL